MSALEQARPGALEVCTRALVGYVLDGNAADYIAGFLAYMTKVHLGSSDASERHLDFAAKVSDLEPPQPPSGSETGV
jgi:hypothetical protein